MILQAIRALFAKPLSPHQALLARYRAAQEECEQARAAYLDRCDKGDDRGAGERWRPYHLARCRMLRAELELRAVSQ